jgi:hydrogenase expression/formation protein HypC
VGGISRDISLDLCPDVSVGEYVLIHTGFAIQKVDEKEAEETLELLKQMAEAI